MSRLAKQNLSLQPADAIIIHTGWGKLSSPVHQIALVVNGAHLLENLKLDELVAKNVGEFAFIMEPLKIQGGTGSTVTPMAVR